MTTRALTQPQPHATLIAHGVHRWVTFPNPPPADPAASWISTECKLTGGNRMNDAQLLTDMGTDAVKWTDEYMRRHGSSLPDDDTLVRWFANAIEAGRTAGFREASDE